MNPSVIRISLSNSVYFSFVTFIILWFSGFLYNRLEKTTGSLNMGVVIIIVLSLILIIFLLAITNLLLSEPKKGKISFFDRVISIFLFILASAIILGVLAFLFWYKI